MEGTKKRLRVRVQLLDNPRDRREKHWAVVYSSGLVIRFKLTVTGLIRVVSIRFSAASQSKMSEALGRLQGLFTFTASLEDSKYSTAHPKQFRLSAKVAEMLLIEAHLLKGFWEKQVSAKVVPILHDRPTERATVGNVTASIA